MPTTGLGKEMGLTRFPLNLLLFYFYTLYVYSDYFFLWSFTNKKWFISKSFWKVKKKKKRKRTIESEKNPESMTHPDFLGPSHFFSPPSQSPAVPWVPIPLEVWQLLSNRGVKDWKGAKGQGERPRAPWILISSHSG